MTRRLKIALYIGDGTGNGVGGAELMMAYLGSVWSVHHDVDLVHHRPQLTRERLEEFATDDFSRLNIRVVARDPEPAGGDPVRRFRAARDWHATLSDGYDLFVNCGHWLPPFSHAARGVLLVLFPYYQLPHTLPEIQGLPAWKRLRHRLYHELEWRRRLATYDRVLAISEFAREWTRRRWLVDAAVVYPPVDVDFDAAPKEQLIVSINRFNLRAHKKQLEMMEAFATAVREGLAGWRYASVGGLNATPDNHDYFDRVRAAGAGVGGVVDANLSRCAIKDLLQRGRIFWHAMGLGEDTELNPGRAEHFGIATIEAMAAGCVPVVIDKGGQAEIVEHGVSGFKWKNVDELKTYTRMLAEDSELWARMSAAARAGAQRFSRARFVREMSAICGVELPEGERVRAA